MEDIVEMFGNTLYQLLVLLLAMVIAVQLTLRGVENSDFNIELRMSSSRKVAREQKREPEAEEVETDDENRRKDHGDQTQRWTSGVRVVGFRAGQ
jgi:hypothetical protein